MGLFKSKEPEKGPRVPDGAGLPGGLGDDLDEPIEELIAAGDTRRVDRAIDDAKRAADEARTAEIVGAHLIEQRRCPQCHGKLEVFLYTRACPACGWFARSVPKTGRCVVHLRSGEKIECDAALQVQGDQVLCVRAGVVRTQVMRHYVNLIEYVWEEGELDRAREQVRAEREGVCAWCGRVFAGAEAAPVDEYVAFGTYQERYSFCSEKCAAGFRRQYPARIHRNCYERDCNECDLCIKRYDTRGIKTTNLI